MYDFQIILLEETIGSKLLDMGLGGDILDLTTKTKATIENQME